MATIDLGRIKFSLQGAWNSSTAYTVGDMVLHKNGIWILKRSYVPNSAHNYAPGKKTEGYQDYKTKSDLKNRTSIFDYDMASSNISTNHSLGDHTEFLGTNNEYATVSSDPDFNYNYRSYKNTHKVTVSTSKFLIENYQSNTTLPLYEGETYAFQQHDQSNYLFPLSFSSVADGTNTSGTSLYDSGYVKYFLNNTEVTESVYFATFASSTLFARSGHRRVELTVPYNATLSNDKVYPYCQGTAGTYDSLGISVLNSWEGYLHWDLVSSSLRFRGQWNPNTQYFNNDLVTFNSSDYSTHKLFTRPTNDRRNTLGQEIYRCTVDNINCAPVTGAMEKTRSPLMTESTTTVGRLSTNVNSRYQKWENFSGDNENNGCAWFPNQGPIAWPFKHHTGNAGNIYRIQQYIDKNGTVWIRGSGTEGSLALGNNAPISYFQEVCFKFRDWNDSEDRNYDGTQQRRGLKFTRHGNVPKCVQIEQGYGYSLYLFDNGEVKHVGYGGHGQNGTGNFNNYDQVMNINGLEDVNIIKIATNISQENNTHTCMALSEEGDVYMWGYNGYGQLGNGRTEVWSSAQKIPREFFGSRRIIDIGCTGTGESTHYARTANDYVYAWGRNNVGQCGTGDTTDRYRPVLMSGWDPAANNGIKVLQFSGYSGNTCAYILDGNGFIWACGYNGYGNMFNGNTSNSYSFAKATVSPNGDIVDMWCMGWNSYQSTYARLKNGNTYFAGHSGGYYAGGTGSSGTISTPTQCTTKIDNLKEVCISGTYSDWCVTNYLLDNGRMLTQGYDPYDTLPNPIAGSNWTGEDGTYRPFHTYIPAGNRIMSITTQGIWESSNGYGMISFLGTENGQIFGWGYSGGTCQGHSNWCNDGSNGGIMTNGGQGR